MQSGRRQSDQSLSLISEEPPMSRWLTTANEKSRSLLFSEKKGGNVAMRQITLFCKYARTMLAPCAAVLFWGYMM